MVTTSRECLIRTGWSKVIKPYAANKELNSSQWTEQASNLSVLRACVGWVCELGIGNDMTYYQKKNLALINGAAFISLLLALPGTFVLILMGFGHPFSLLVGGLLTACSILGFNGARRVEWSRALFAFAPTAIILGYSFLELSSHGLNQPLNDLLIRQGLCFALLLPLLVYGFEPTQKVAGIAGVCLLIFEAYDVGSMQLGAFREGVIAGINHGLFSVLSLLQFAGLEACVLYVQTYTVQHARQAEQANKKLKSMAIRDSLTGIFNHGFIEQLIGDAINRSKRSQTPLALLMIDIDYFKQINDTLGHNAGDEVLVRLTHLLNSNKRSTDYLGRWGGDELILLLTDTDLVGADNLAEKLRRLVETQIFLSGGRLTVSIGASEYNNSDTTAKFISRADAAMYRAKRAGRNQVEGLEGGNLQFPVAKPTSITTDIRR